MPLCAAGLLSLQNWWQNLHHTRHSTTSAGLKVYKPTTPGMMGSVQVHSSCMPCGGREPMCLGKQLDLLALGSICITRQAHGCAGFRGRIITARENLWAGRPYRPLTEGLRKTGGRNNQGRITSWHRGGGTKRLYRQVSCWLCAHSECLGIVLHAEHLQPVPVKLLQLLNEATMLQSL